MYKKNLNLIRMKNVILIIVLITPAFIISCGGSGSKEKSAEEIITESLSTGREYYQSTFDYFFGQSWLNFDGATVEFSVRSRDGWDNTIDWKNITGKYSIANYDNSYTLELDFGREDINIDYLTGGTRPKRRNLDYPLPKYLKVELDSLNKLTIKNWKLVKPKEEDNEEIVD